MAAQHGEAASEGLIGAKLPSEVNSDKACLAILAFTRSS